MESKVLEYMCRRVYRRLQTSIARLLSKHRRHLQFGLCYTQLCFQMRHLLNQVLVFLRCSFQFSHTLLAVSQEFFRASFACFDLSKLPSQLIDDLPWAILTYWLLRTFSQKQLVMAAGNSLPLHRETRSLATLPTTVDSRRMRSE